MVFRGRKKKTCAHSSYVGMVDPLFENDGPNCMRDDDGVAVLCRDGKNQIVSTVPGGEVFPKLPRFNQLGLGGGGEKARPQFLL